MHDYAEDKNEDIYDNFNSEEDENIVINLKTNNKLTARQRIDQIQTMKKIQTLFHDDDEYSCEIDDYYDKIISEIYHDSDI